MGYPNQYAPIPPKQYASGGYYVQTAPQQHQYKPRQHQYQEPPQQQYQEPPQQQYQEPPQQQYQEPPQQQYQEPPQQQYQEPPQQQYQEPQQSSYQGYTGNPAAKQVVVSSQTDSVVVHEGGSPDVKYSPPRQPKQGLQDPLPAVDSTSFVQVPTTSYAASYVPAGGATAGQHLVPVAPGRSEPVPTYVQPPPSVVATSSQPSVPAQQTSAHYSAPAPSAAPPANSVPVPQQLPSHPAHLSILGMNPEAQIPLAPNQKYQYQVPASNNQYQQLPASTNNQYQQLPTDTSSMYQQVPASNMYQQLPATNNNQYQQLPVSTNTQYQFPYPQNAVRYVSQNSAGPYAPSYEYNDNNRNSNKGRERTSSKDTEADKNNGIFSSIFGLFE